MKVGMAPRQRRSQSVNAWTAPRQRRSQMIIDCAWLHPANLPAKIIQEDVARSKFSWLFLQGKGDKCVNTAHMATRNSSRKESACIRDVLVRITVSIHGWGTYVVQWLESRNSNPMILASIPLRDANYYSEYKPGWTEEWLEEG